MRLIRLYLALIVVLCGVMLAIHLIGGLYPNPIAVLFTNPDGSLCHMPCLFGVRPGEMTVEEGLEVLDKHPLTHGMQLDARDSEAALYYNKGFEGYIHLYSDGKHITQVLLMDEPVCTKCNNINDTRTQLGTVLGKGLLGNEVLYFAEARPDWDANLNNLPPQTDIQLCFSLGSACFENSASDDFSPWQYMPFHSLQVSARSSR